MFQPTEGATPRVNSKVNYVLWIIMMCQHRFTYCNKCTTVVEDVNIGEGCACVWAGVDGNSLYQPLNSAVNLNCSKK